VRGIKRLVNEEFVILRCDKCLSTQSLKRSRGGFGKLLCDRLGDIAPAGEGAVAGILYSAYFRGTEMLGGCWTSFASPVSLDILIGRGHFPWRWPAGDIVEVQHVGADWVHTPTRLQ
jgi:hypothetical protein